MKKLLLLSLLLLAPAAALLNFWVAVCVAFVGAVLGIAACLSVLVLLSDGSERPVDAAGEELLS